MDRRRTFMTGMTAVGLFAIVLSSQSTGADKRPADTCVAVVNDETINLSTVDSVLNQRPILLTPPTTAQLRQLRLEALTVMIDDMLIRQFMRRQGPKIDQATFDKQYQSLLTSLKATGKSLGDYLKENAMTEEYLRSNIIIMLQFDRYVKEHTTEADLKKHWLVNKDYFDRAAVRTRHIVIRLTKETTPEEKEAARTRLRTLRAEIVAGKIDFESAAKKYSQCPSAPKGGDIGFIFRRYQNIDETFTRIAFSMKVGELSDVVETDVGLHLIKVIDRKEGIESKYEICAEEVRESYADELRTALLAQLRAKAKVKITLP